MKVDWEKAERFGDFAESKRMDGNKMKIEEILGQEIAVIAYRVAKSKIKSGDYLTIQFVRSGESESRVLFTGSRVLEDQLREYESKLPFLTSICKVHNYYCFT